MSEVKFLIVANAEFTADGIDDALRKLSAYFGGLADDEAPATIFQAGSVNITPIGFASYCRDVDRESPPHRRGVKSK